MAQIDLIKTLREETGAGVMDCQKALSKANNDITKAKEILKEEGLLKADQKASRETKAGVISGFLNENQKIGALLELRCETDFVAQNEEFINLANNLVKQVAQENPKDLESFLSQNYIEDKNETVDHITKGATAKFGEKIVIEKFIRWETTGILTLYIHHGNRVGTLVELEISNMAEEYKQLGKDLAMQVAAMNPLYLAPENIPEEKIEAMKQEYLQEIDQNKPLEVRNKILEGKLSKKFEEICLLKQKFIKNDEITVEQYVKNFGENVKIGRFIRFQA